MFITRDASRPQHTTEIQASIAVGRPRFLDATLQGLAREQGLEAAWKEAFRRDSVRAPENVHRDFAVALFEPDGQAFLAVDRFSICTLCYRITDGRVLVAERADELAGPNAELDPQALFDYLYFHVIPAPRTIFKGVYRLPAGHYGLFKNGKLTVAPWWRPRFEEDRRVPLADLKAEFRQLLRDSVAGQLDGGKVGCFLSGGTDSSTVVGTVRDVTGESPQAFSIGFEADGYDEMEYARLAARHFGAKHHEYYVTPDDLVRSIPGIAVYYDQPFGNSSVLPAYYCAKVAREAGITRMLAGDGGDELFAGNSRYAKQRIFSAYERMPAVLRNGFFEPLLTGTSLHRKIPLLKKVVSYVEQARVSMPQRMQMYNLLTRLAVREVLTPEFLAQVDVKDPLTRQCDTYDAADASSLVNRMLWFDWKYTLADNDLPKVVGATALAGMPVGFPLLDDRMVDFSLRLEPELKVKGLKLRWFFKQALRDFLPAEIIAKKKHGFGLPFGVWLMRDHNLAEFAFCALQQLRSDGIVDPSFVDRLRSIYLPARPGYYGEMAWVLMMLSAWLHSGQHECEVRLPR
jgi:asparagine synthase (glutamine-hydrolysing)